MAMKIKGRLSQVAQLKNYTHLEKVEPYYHMKVLDKYPMTEKSESVKSGQYNLFDMLSRFPKNGQGMKVYKKTWPENCYWQI
jgi:hypothetical protein